jgi:hypothetical protein
VLTIEQQVLEPARDKTRDPYRGRSKPEH